MDLIRSLAREAGRGTLSRTVERTARWVDRARSWKVSRFSFTNGNTASMLHMMEYVGWCRRFFCPSQVRVLSIACDATRISGRDTMACALYAPEIGLGAWAPHRSEP